MTDLEELKILLTRWNVKFSEDEQGVIVYGGYQGFYTAFEFDSNGAFLKMGAWE